MLRFLPQRIAIKPSVFIRGSSLYSTTGSDNINDEISLDEFEEQPVLPEKFSGGGRSRRPRYPPPAFRMNLPAPRYKRMAINQDWASVWPAPRMFSPSAVPLPLHMGLINTASGIKPRPGKVCNPELMKIPNFLHLAPPTVKKQCQELKRFCTPWPKGLETDKLCEKHFPIEIISSDYCHASPSIRDPKARVVNLKIKMSVLQLDYHAKDKLKRLLGTKYDKKTDIITIMANKCPLKIQNYEYSIYLLTAVYFESLKTEDWENEKEPSDWEHFYWEKSASRKSLEQYLKRVRPNENIDESVLELDEIKGYGRAVSDLHDKSENRETIENYKMSVEKLLFG